MKSSWYDDVYGKNELKNGSSKNVGAHYDHTKFKFRGKKWVFLSLSLNFLFMNSNTYEDKWDIFRCEMALHREHGRFHENIGLIEVIDGMEKFKLVFLMG